MALSATRLTLYALLSSLEESLRETILLHLEPQNDVISLLGPERTEKASQRREADRVDVESQATLADLLAYTDLQDLWEILNSSRSLLPTDLGQTIKSSTAQLQRLVPIRNRVMHSRPVEFEDLPMTVDLLRELATTIQDKCFSALRETLGRLERDPSFVLGLEIPNLELDDRWHNLPTPDFDETGFIGRKTQLDRLLILLKGPFPVITVVAEGGVGKTALALRAAYHLLDELDCPFDSIVWTTSKTMQLTAHDIRRIEGAINDSLGMFSAVSQHLSGTRVEDPIDEVLQYLAEFKILLIIDNLETVLDDRIRSFLERLPNGSKVLITSRIGLGAFEVPLKLERLETHEAINLMRALAAARDAEALVKMNNKKLGELVGRLNNNPGWIKWLISVVQAGQRPEEACANPGLFLDFCMSNVHQYLDERSRNLLRAMLCVQGLRSQAELGFLTQMNIRDLRAAILQLLSTNMLIMDSQASGSTFESKYQIGELARIYLLKHHPISESEFVQFSNRQKVLAAAADDVRREQSTDPYALRSIATRSQSDLIVAKYLMDSLQRLQGGDNVGALELVDRAKSLAPGYYEVHRVESFIHAKAGNLAAARSSYECALELEPTSAALRVWYAGFLLRSLQDPEAALAQLAEAETLDPNAFAVQLETARAYVWQDRHDEASRSLELIAARNDLGVRQRKKVIALTLQLHQRRAESFVNNHNNQEALEALEDLKGAFESCPAHLQDSQMRARVGRTAFAAKRCEQHLQDPYLRTKATEYIAWVLDVSGGSHTGDH